MPVNLCLPFNSAFESGRADKHRAFGWHVPRHAAQRER
jgi:hypothetical protein